MVVDAVARLGRLVRSAVNGEDDLAWIQGSPAHLDHKAKQDEQATGQ